MSDFEKAAQVCHETNRAFCLVFNGDNSQKSWDEAEQWQRDSAVNGVKFVVENREKGLKPEDVHQAWMDAKLADGWKYGPIKDAEKKEHPCLVAYEELPEGEKKKDELFRAIVDVLVPA